MWWFVDSVNGFNKQVDVDGICSFCAKYPKIPIILIYLPNAEDRQENVVETVDTAQSSTIDIHYQQYINYHSYYSTSTDCHPMNGSGASQQHLTLVQKQEHSTTVSTTNLFSSSRQTNHHTSTLSPPSLDMDRELMTIAHYLENSTGSSDLAVVCGKSTSALLNRLRYTTRDMCYYYTIIVKWFAREKHPQYPAISDCSVDLYHDACHSLNGNNLFADIYNSWSRAKRLILIMGWSLDYRLRLNRYNHNNETVGELLCRKANEGVVICIFLWQDILELMRTFNRDTKRYFREHCPHKIHIRLRRRKASFGQYSHHQKLIICDGEDGLHAYLGGLDITIGRFDTPRHSLFQTLDDIHNDDFYNSVFSHHKKKGVPREPWHDCHSRVRGDIVWHMLNHFGMHFLYKNPSSQKRKEQFNSRVYQMINDLYPGNIGEISRVTGEWMTEFYSSISTTQIFGKRLSVDDGIHRAYVSAINNADKFIYIENQYFIGGSYLWLPPVFKRTRLHGAPNSIPVLLADRIIHKAMERESFKVYIIMPLIPDGKPGSIQVDGVMYYEFKTIEMMYHRISTAFKELGIDKRVEDFLFFACLGKVEWNPTKQRLER